MLAVGCVTPKSPSRVDRPVARIRMAAASPADTARVAEANAEVTAEHDMGLTHVVTGQGEGFDNQTAGHTVSLDVDAETLVECWP